MSAVTMSELTEQFRGVTATPVHDQAKTFLRAFVVDFAGNFEEILQTADEFLKFHGGKADEVNELDEHKAHYFLEKRGEAITVKAMRDTLKEIDLDNNNQVALIEYLLWKHKKTVTELFTPPGGGVNQKLLDALNESIGEYERLAKEQAERDAEIAKLELLAAGGGVKAMRAKNELAALKSQDETAKNKARITAEARKRAAQKAVDADDGIDHEEVARRAKLDAEEQERIAAKKAADAAEKERAAAESRERLKARAALWGN